MNDLQSQNNNQLPGPEIEYNTNIEDSNSLIFKGSIPEKTIRPTEKLNDTYTFSVNGELKFGRTTYYTQIVCSYGIHMLRNSSQVSLNVIIDLFKMDTPMFIPAIDKEIDNLQIKIEDGTVNMVQN